MIGPEIAFILVAAFAAGLIDAIAGGGGLVQLPALLAAYPATPIPTLLGTSKIAGLCGTLSAALRYVGRITLPWRLIGPGMVVAAAAACGGAMAVSRLSPDLLRPLVPVLLTAVLGYTLLKPALGREHRPVPLTGARRAGGLGCIAAIAAYDGFFGPGTGSFLMLLFARGFGFDFLHAAAAARFINVASNLGALAWFGLRGDMLLALGLAMAVANIAGAQLGARLALRHGAGLVRGVFVVVVIALIARNAWQAWLPG